MSRCDPCAIGVGVESEARSIAWQIVELSGYDCRPEMQPLVPAVIEYLARTDFVLQTAAVAWAHGIELSLTVRNEDGDDVTDERPYQLATLDAFDTVAAVVADRIAAESLADIPPDIKRALDDGNY